ncbi:MAG: anion permease [Corynebacterium sp.]|nr:anion permease [Corynebacterium sp.]
MNDVQQAPSPAPQQENNLWWHLSFGGALTVAVVAFLLWSLGYIDADASRPMLITTIVLGTFMAFNIGGNDVANSFGTSVGAGTLTMKQALIVAAVFEVSGAVLAGGQVTDTVKSGIVDLDAITLDANQFAFIMMSSLVGAAVWLLLATRMGWPVSTTHSIIGGIVGAALTLGAVEGIGGADMVQWDKIGQIAISWVLSPLLGCIVSVALFGFIKRNILSYNYEVDEEIRKLRAERIGLRQKFKASFERLNEIQQLAYSNAMTRDAALIQASGFNPDELESDYYRDLYSLNQRSKELDSHRALERWAPVLAAGGMIIISAMLLFKGLDNLNLNISTSASFMIMGMLAVVVWLAISIVARSLRHIEIGRATFVIFSWLQVFTASTFAFSHGSNDIANAVGPFAAVLDVLRTGEISSKAEVPRAALLLCGVALIAGLWFVGRFVIQTVGHGLTEIHPASGFAAELSAAAVVIGASALGLPVSSTHILIGAVLGVGIVNRAANWKLMRPIVMAWIITLPVAAGISAVAVLAFNGIWG